MVRVNTNANQRTNARTSADINEPSAFQRSSSQTAKVNRNELPTQETTRRTDAQSAVDRSFDAGQPSYDTRDTTTSGSNQTDYFSQARERVVSQPSQETVSRETARDDVRREFQMPTSMRAVGMPTVDNRQRQGGDEGVPYLEMPKIDFPVMSKIADDTLMEEISDNLAESGADMTAIRMGNKGFSRSFPDQFSDAFPSQATFDEYEATKLRRRAAIADKRIESRDHTMSSESETNDFDRPDSIYNRSFGYDESGIDRTPRFKQQPMKRPTSVRKAEMRQAKDSFNGKDVGNGVYEKINGRRSLGLREVGIGAEEMMEAISQNPDMINRLFGTYEQDVDVTDWSLSDVAQFVNQREIFVGTFKPPNNQGPDSQRRVLHILEDTPRGIYIHPIMAAMYTADFDGDDMNVSFDPMVERKMLYDPMDYMAMRDDSTPLNMDWLYVSKIKDGYVDGKSARDYVREIMFAGMDLDFMGPLVDAVIELSEVDMGDDKSKSKAYTKVFRAARKVASSAYPNDKRSADRLMGSLCKSVYGGMRDIFSYNIMTTTDSEIRDISNLPSPRTYGDYAIYRIFDDMVEGRTESNFQEVKVALTAFLGNVEGKNAPFRFTADIGKMIKMDPRLRIGDEFVVDPNNNRQMQMFFESTMRYVTSLKMAREIKKAGHSQYYTQVLRETIVSRVGFYGDVNKDGSQRYENYFDFLGEFAKAYYEVSSMINQSNLVYKTNMEINYGSKEHAVSSLKRGIDSVTYGDLAEPMLSVYGLYSVRKMMNVLADGAMREGKIDPNWAGNPNATGKSLNPTEREYNYRSTDENFWITGKYLDYSLARFKTENKLIRGEKDSKTKQIRETPISKRMNDVSAQFAMLMSIADKKTGAASKFNEKVYGKEKKDKKGRKYVDYKDTTVEMMSTLLTELDRLDKTMNDRTDQMIWVDNVVNVLIASGTEMFAHFNADSTAGFLRSKWARKLVEHRANKELLGGVRTAMVFDYRMERVTSLKEELDEIREVGTDIDRFRDTYNNLSLAKDELADSSEVWHGIIREFDAEDTPGMESVFQMIRDNKLRQKVNGREYPWIGMDATKFWSNPGKHTTLRSVIEDLDMDRQTKWMVICDVVRYWENDPYLKPYEIGYQLEIGSDSAYSIDSAGQQGALGSYYDLQKAFNRWGDMSQKALQKEVDDAYLTHKDNKGALMRTLSRLDSSPWELVEIDDMMYADSLLSVKDKTYAQTEKSSQHPWTNVVYHALSYQWNGGFYNDIYRTDDRLMGLQSASSIDLHDIVHLLADEKAELYVYNEYGEYAMLTREILLTQALGRSPSFSDEALERDIWEFLRKNPIIASMLRRHNACAVADTDGSGYIGSKLSLSETISASEDSSSDPVENTKYLLREHPAYGAIISLASRSLVSRKWGRVGSVTRNERERISKIEDYLSGQIYLYASSGASPSVAAEEILASMGITNAKIRDVMKPDFEKYLDSIGLDADDFSDGEGSESDNAADDIWDYSVKMLASYIDEVHESVPVVPNVSVAPRPSVIGCDIASCASFWDVVQELSGAKTDVSTGVEGQETFDYSKWATSISSNDRYADIQSLEVTRLDESWNGMWTNLTNDDGSPVFLEMRSSETWDSSVGACVTMTRGSETKTYYLHPSGTDLSFTDAKSDAGISEMIVMVPEGQVVMDRSTDGHATPLQSLGAYMISKRSNGAETFNLKAKKSGIDEKDSITKMRGKHKMVTDLDDEGNPNTHEVNYFDYVWELNNIAQQNGENGLLAAKMKVAQDMLVENEELGYKDMTLANYMSIAELMVIEGNDGNIYLRSIEMLLTAIKNRLGTSVDDMNPDEVRKAADAIVRDTSETGVGIARMTSIDALNEVRPHSKSSATNAIRPTSSVFHRNYDLLSQISRNAKKNGVTQVSEDMAGYLTRKYTDKKAGVVGVREVIERSSLARGYSIVGFAGAFNRNDEVNWTIGPSNAVVIGDNAVDKKTIEQICHRAYKLGMTIIVSSQNRDKIPNDMRFDAMPCSDEGDVLVPCFDMRLNGAESHPWNGGRFAIFQAPFSRYVTMVEDSINEFENGDAQVTPMQSLTDRIKNVDAGTKRVLADELFPNVFGNRKYNHAHAFKMSFVSGSEVSHLIMRGSNYSIDYGIVEGGHGYEQRKKDVDDAIERYRTRYSEINADGMLVDAECKPGDIVAWVEIGLMDDITHRESYVFAPVIPFPLHGPKKNVPANFVPKAVQTVDDDRTMYEVVWENITDIANSFAKYFDSSGAANKGIMSFTQTVDDNRVLLDGTSVDAYVAKASTDSRKVGTDRRIKTMISLMTIARIHGYNFARTDGSFPNHPEVKERLLVHENGRQPISRSEWKRLLEDDSFVFTDRDEKINAFLRYECTKIFMDNGNPSDYLANVYQDENGIERNTHVMWEFEAMFELGMKYEDFLLRYLNMIDSSLCPSGLDDDREDYLFRLKKDGDDIARDFEFGVLQMKVPHRLSSNQMVYMWDNVYIGLSFFGEDSSAFSRPNVNGSSIMLDAYNTMANYGKVLDEKSERMRTLWATSDLGRVSRDGGAIGKAESPRHMKQIPILDKLLPKHMRTRHMSQ